MKNRDIIYERRQLRRKNYAQKMIGPLLCLAALFIFSGGGLANAAESDGVYTTIEQLDGKRVAVGTGTVWSDVVKEVIPSAEVVYLDSTANIVNSLLGGKVEAVAADEPIIAAIVAGNDRLTYIKEHLNHYDNAFFVAKDGDAPLLEEFNSFIRQLRDDGTLDELQKIWFANDESKKSVAPYETFPAPNGTLRLAQDGEEPPFTYMRDGRIVGYDIDILARFCEARGYGLKPVTMDFSGLIPAVQSGKCDIGGGAVTVTRERAESVTFTEPIYSGGGVLMVRAGTSGAATSEAENTEGPSMTKKAPSFFDELKASFERTFIREDRWRLFAEGIGVTLLITVLSILLGTALGFGLYLLCCGGNSLANIVTRFCVWLVQGMPAVVLLMILYYIVFSNTEISGVAVAVVAFTLTFGSAVYGMLRMGVGAVDSGQTEAAYALGYGRWSAFFGIVLPQALPHFMPSYRSEVTALVKATAIVGYIAVQDVTKMGDIVRSRTYEAFFPLIAVAVIYFIMAGSLNFLIDRIQVYLDPKRRKRGDILSGLDVSGNDRKGADRHD